MIRRSPRSTPLYSSAASDVYKRQFTDNILAGYFCEVDGTDEIEVDMQELSVAKWVSREEIPASLEELSLTNEMISVFRLDKGDF